jgi:GDP-L-fucose synthase
MDFISAMPTNLYGPNDNYDLNNSHVLPALIRKMHVAQKENLKTVEIWGSGNPLREFLHVDDLATACVFLMNNYSDPKTVNVGFGEDITIKELAETIKKVIKFKGELSFDTTKPDGTPKKLMDSARLNNLGWIPTISLIDGITKVYEEVNKSKW